MHIVVPERKTARIADAVAVAGLQAAAVAGPRAVLLVLAAGARDGSRHAPLAVRRYLAAIHVPLFVWSVDEPDNSAREDWGTIEHIGTQTRLDHAYKLLREELAAQRVVLVEGRLLPQSITLTASAAGLLAPP